MLSTTYSKQLVKTVEKCKNRSSLGQSLENKGLVIIVEAIAIRSELLVQEVINGMIKIKQISPEYLIIFTTLMNYDQNGFEAFVEKIKVYLFKDKIFQLKIVFKWENVH